MCRIAGRITVTLITRGETTDFPSRSLPFLAVVVMVVVFVLQLRYISLELRMERHIPEE